MYIRRIRSMKIQYQPDRFQRIDWIDRGPNKTDTDMDGVPDYRDCRPLDPTRHMMAIPPEHSYLPPWRPSMGGKPYPLPRQQLPPTKQIMDRLKNFPMTESQRQQLARRIQTIRTAQQEERTGMRQTSRGRIPIRGTTRTQRVSQY